MKSSGKVGNGPMNKWLNFAGDPDHHLDTGIVCRIRHYWEIRKVVNGHKSAAASSHSFILIHQGLLLSWKIMKVKNFISNRFARCQD